MNDIPALEVRDLVKTYRLGNVEVQALRGVSCRIEAGEYVAVMGPSGSGKSTLMNLLGCLDRPSSGRYILDGLDVSTLDDNALANVRLQKLGFIFQGFNLLARTNALRNVGMPLFYAGIGRADRDAAAAERLREVGLADRMHHKPNELSGGQQQRVAIARALVNDPAVLLADEPTGNLDSETSVEIMSVFRQLNAGGRTIVIVTHDDSVARNASRIIRVQDGKIVPHADV
jgi:putative ABC transport system ATP-binding protein